MKIHSLHEWDLAPEAAADIQRSLVGRLNQNPLTAPPRFVAGADLSFTPHSPLVYAGVVVLRFPELEVVETRTQVIEAHFPYIPGFLSFREIPPLLPLFEALETEPDVVLCDGHGIAHPRGLGLAAHLGLILDMPTLGCAKTPFVGDWAPPAPDKGSRSPLVLDGNEVGTVLRTRDGVKPVFVSPGHRIDRAGAVTLVEACLTGTRLPETTRQAHQLVNRIRKQAE